MTMPWSAQSELTARETHALALIASILEVEGRSPSLAEIMRRMGLSEKTQAERVVTTLRRRGLVARTGRRNSIRLTGRGQWRLS